MFDKAENLNSVEVWSRQGKAILWFLETLNTVISSECTVERQPEEHMFDDIAELSNNVSPKRRDFFTNILSKIEENKYGGKIKFDIEGIDFILDLLKGELFFYSKREYELVTDIYKQCLKFVPKCLFGLIKDGEMSPEYKEQILKKYKKLFHMMNMNNYMIFDDRGAFIEYAEQMKSFCGAMIEHSGNDEIEYENYSIFMKVFWESHVQYYSNIINSFKKAE